MESAKKCECFNESLKPSSGSVWNPNAGNTTNDRPQSYTGQAAPAARIMYRPAFADVRDYMRTCTGRTLRSEVAEEEARAFLNYNDAKGWRITDWQEAARRWTNRTESRKGQAIYESPQQTEADEERRKAEEERRRVDILIDKIQHKAFTDEDGNEARKVLDMILADNFTDGSRAGVAKKVGQRLIDLWAWTYAEKIIMEEFTGTVGADAQAMKERIYSGNLSTEWYWNGMELKVRNYLEQWEKGPGRPIRRLTPIKIGAQKGSAQAQAVVPAFWQYLKTLVDRRDFSGGVNGALAKKIAEKIAREDYNGKWGDVAMWIATGVKPDRSQPDPDPAPAPTPTSPNQPQPLKGIINKAVRNIRAQT